MRSYAAFSCGFTASWQTSGWRHVLALKQQALLLRSCLTRGAACLLLSVVADANCSRVPATSCEGRLVSAKRGCRFEGGRAGYAFKRGPQGQGFYLDAAKQHSPAPAQQRKQPGGHHPPPAPGTPPASAGENGGAAGGILQPAKGTLLAEALWHPASCALCQLAAHPARAVLQLQPGHFCQVPHDITTIFSAQLSQHQAVPLLADVTLGAGHGMSQRELIAAAFAGDDVQADFEAAKATEAEAELPQEELPTDLPGWGLWASQRKAPPKWLTEARARAAECAAPFCLGPWFKQLLCTTCISTCCLQREDLLAVSSFNFAMDRSIPVTTCRGRC